MSIWKDVGSILLAGVCAGSFLWSYESSAEPRKYDNRLICKASSKKPQTKKQDRRTANTSQPPRQSPQQQTKPQQPRKPVSQKPQNSLSELISNVQKSKVFNQAEKGMLTDWLKLMSQTKQGQWILQNIPHNMEFDIIHGQDNVGGSYGGTKVLLNEKYFRNMAQAQTPAEYQEALWRATTTVSHELTHACQHNLSMYKKSNLSSINLSIVIKLSELHAILSELEVQDQLLDLPSFGALRSAKPELYSTFLRNVSVRKRQEGLSPEMAARFARTEAVKVLWRNRPSEHLKIGNDLFFMTDRGTEMWNASYNGLAFRNVVRRGKDYWRQTGASVDAILRQASSVMGVDISPEFFKQEKSFQYDRGRLVGYMDGIRNQEIDYLSIGLLGINYEDNRLRMVLFDTSRIHDGHFKDYWYGTSHVRATYTVKNKQLVGLYKEYDYAGNQVAEIPCQNNAPNGIGWVIQNGQRVPKRFKNGVCYDMNEQQHVFVKKDANYWYQRYLNFQKNRTYGQ